MEFLQLACLLLVLVLLRSFVPIGKKVLAFAFSLALGILFAIQFSSVILTGNIADYRFYENFSLKDATSVSDFFGTELLFIILALALATLIVHFLGKVVRTRLANKILPIGLLLAGFVIMGFNGGILNNAYDTLKLKFAGSASFEEALKSLGIDADEYVLKKDVKASPGKNIIVLSLESLEKGYLGEKLAHLTPNLRQIVKDGTLYDMEQSPAGGWTSASMYALMSGVPAFFGLHGNSVFQNNYENKLTSLPDVLKSAGYDLQYFIGNKEYSGIDDMLKTFGFDVKSEKDFETQYEKLVWGIHDKDLFEEFKKELRLKKNSDRPFAMFLSSISTHFPNGVLDKRMDSILPPQPSNLEFMVSATDYFVGDLMAFLSKERMLDNTVFYIFPDHLLMSTTTQVFDQMQERSLFLLTNADSDDITYDIKKPITQIDVSKIILEGARVEHNAKFLTDFIADPDKNAFLSRNNTHILRLNDAALKTFNCKDGIIVEVDATSGNFIVKNHEGIIVATGDMPTGPNCHRVLFDEQLRPFEDKSIAFAHITKDIPELPYLDIFTIENTVYASLKGKPNFGLTKKGEDQVVFEKSDIDLILEINASQKENFIRITSSTYNSKKGSSFSMGDQNIRITRRGLTMVILNSVKKYELKTFDTYGSEEEAAEFISLLEQLSQDHVPYIIFAHDSAHKNLKPFSENLEDLGFHALAGLKNRETYIAHNLSGKMVEEVGDASISEGLPYPKSPTNKKLYFTSPISDFLKDTDRFIAHAGGSIDNLKYTNALEALDLNYQKGFRLFELDISETKDGHFVATHDWKHWATQTNYSGELPVSRAEFLAHKIYGKYTPMDMEAINTWFASHKDAVLVTDKINEPVKFSEMFVDKNRLQMELFTLDAVEKAAEANVSTLISALPLSKIQGDKLDYLKKNKVTAVAVPRTNIPAQKELFKTLGNNDIKVYVYQVNVEPGKDEKYVLENEIGIVYGMYADNWIFDPEQK
ncbi:sulfatase-like hydrolase/transferase [Maribacter algicola]|uniref:Sulfatase-like hydrolase/transferase n=1 Tax=Meishania litoralis TaxID=3434685 RepID=A0ACC7LHR8_9FLAO